MAQPSDLRPNRSAPVAAVRAALAAVGLAAAGCSASDAIGHLTTGSGSSGAGTGSGTGTNGASSTTSGGTFGEAGAGAACASNTECVSGLCGTRGAGHCCTVACRSGDATCGAVDCDSQGSCVFPSSSVDCGSHGCDAGFVNAMACDGLGSCVALPEAECPGQLGCAADQLTCVQRCQVSDDCRPGLRCRAGACIPRQSAGHCQSADDCATGKCLGGACCATTCAASDPTCAASSCDLGTGSCQFPSTSAVCGSAAARHCQGAELVSGYCDGQGGCGPVAAEPCANHFACDPASVTCATSCADAGSAACIPGDVCSGGGGCCPGFGPGGGFLLDGGLFVDTFMGDDSICCGGPIFPCRTLTHAMQAVADSHAQGISVFAEGSNPYTVPAEHFPIHLGYGVQLYTHADWDAPLQTLFQVYPYPGEANPGPVAILSSVGDLIGFNLRGANLTRIAIQVGDDAGTPTNLTLSGVTLYGTDTALDIAPGANVTLGPNLVTAGSSTATLVFSDIGIGSVLAHYGVRCQGTGDHPASLGFTDAGLGLSLANTPYSADPPPAWWFEASGNVGLFAGPYCLVKLSAANGFVNDDIAVQAVGSAAVDLGLAIIASRTIGVQLLGDDGGAGPTVSLSGSFVEGTACAGVDSRAGSLFAANSGFGGSHFGIVVAGGGYADLSDGGNIVGGGLQCGGGSGATCPADFPISYLPGHSPGAALVNLSPATSLQLGATAFIDFSGAAAPSTWLCADGTLQSCVCSAADCSGASAPADGAALVGLAANPAPFVANGPSSSAACLDYRNY